MDLKKGNMKKWIFLITFAILLYTVAQNPEVIGAFWGWFTGIISPVILGLCLAFVLNIFMVFFDGKLLKGLGKSKKAGVRKLKRPLSLILTIITVFGAITLFLWIIIPQVGETMRMIAEAVPAFIQMVIDEAIVIMTDLNLSVDNLKELQVNWEEIQETAFKWLKIGSQSAISIATSLSGSIFSTLFDLIVAIIIAIYVLLQKERIADICTKAARAFLKDAHYEKVMEVARLSRQSFASFITGQLLEACILGGLCFVGMLIFGFPYASVVSVLVGVTALIPMFGAWIGGGISAILILMVDPMKALLFLIFIVVLQQLEGNLIYPKVVGKSIGLPGLLVLVAVIVGGNLFSVVGILVSVPLCSVLYTLFKESIDDRLDKKKAAAAVVGEGEQNASVTEVAGERNAKELSGTNDLETEEQTATENEK